MISSRRLEHQFQRCNGDLSSNFIVDFVIIPGFLCANFTYRTAANLGVRVKSDAGFNWINLTKTRVFVRSVMDLLWVWLAVTFSSVRMVFFRTRVIGDFVKPFLRPRLNSLSRRYRITVFKVKIKTKLRLCGLVTDVISVKRFYRTSTLFTTLHCTVVFTKRRVVFERMMFSECS